MSRVKVAWDITKAIVFGIVWLCIWACFAALAIGVARKLLIWGWS